VKQKQKQINIKREIKRTSKREMDEVEIAKGVFMPTKIAFGTYKLRDEMLTKQAVLKALLVGYANIDLASIYKNEQIIGDALHEYVNSDCDRTRRLPFIASKISPQEMHSEKLVEQAFERILNRLRVDRIDLIMLHWPGISKVPPCSALHKEKRRIAWKMLEKIMKRGSARAIGVSNYQIEHLREMFDWCEIRPAVNQIEVHPLWPQEELIEFCEKEGIKVVAYSPFGGEGAPLLDRNGFLRENNVFEDSEKDLELELDSELEKRGIKQSQVLLAWSLRRVSCVVVKASSAARIEENYLALERLRDVKNDADACVLFNKAIDRWENLKFRKKFAWDSNCIQ